MVSGTLYTYAKSPKGVKSQVAAAYSGFDLKVVTVAEGDTSRPHVPAFESSEGDHLFEANAIASAVATEALRGGERAQDRAQVLQWTNYGITDVASAVCSWVYPVLGLVEATAASVARAKEDLLRVFHCLDAALRTRTFLVGERVTLADICMAADLLLAYEHVADEAWRKPFVNVNRWFLTVVNQPQFIKVVGKVQLVAKATEFDPKKFAASKQKPKEEKPKAASAEKPKAAAKPKDDEEEEEDELLQEPKQNDPFAEMPKGTFNFDEFKRTYSNNDTLTVAIPYFWQHFDKEHYSIWFCEYKYASELTQTFMSGNLIGGMFQRIDKLRKNAFASMCVLGENNNNTICGVWVFKGQGLAFPLCQDWTTDYESYEWRKMDPDNETDRKLVNSFWLHEIDYNGKKFANGKIFK